MNARSPIFIEIAGTPAAGKTTLAERLHHYFNANNISCSIAEEPALRYPGNMNADKLLPAFNEWTLAESQATINRHRLNRLSEVVVLDRGVIDSLYWLSWFATSRGYSLSDYHDSIQTARAHVRLTGIVIVLTCSYEVAFVRRPSSGRIMNAGVYPQILANYQKRFVSKEIGLDSRAHLRLDTSSLSVVTVESTIRAFLDTPREGDREDILAALVRCQSKNV